MWISTQFLQLGKSGYKFSKKLEPTSPFYSYFREAIMETYQTDLGLGIDDLGIKLHLLGLGLISSPWTILGPTTRERRM